MCLRAHRSVKPDIPKAKFTLHSNVAQHVDLYGSSVKILSRRLSKTLSNKSNLIKPSSVYRVDLSLAGSVLHIFAI